MKHNKTLSVFDFDETLVSTKSFVRVVSQTGVKELTTQEFSTYKLKSGETFDFTDFDEVIEPTLLPHYRHFKHATETNSKTWILTARDKRNPIRAFLIESGICPKSFHVVALACSNPKSKADWIHNKAKKYKYNSVYFADDSSKNINAVRRILNRSKINHHLDLVL